MFQCYGHRISVTQIVNFSVCNVIAAVFLRIASDIDLTASLVYVFFLLIAFKLIFTVPTWSLRKDKHDPSGFQYTAKRIPIHRFEGMNPSGEFVRSKNVNKILNEIIMYSIRDYVSVWYDELAADQCAVALLRELIEDVCINVTKRLGHVDWEHFLSQDLALHLKEHIEKVKLADKEARPFAVPHFLADAERETAHLRDLALLLIECTMTPEVRNCKTAYILLREIITCKLLKPLMDMLCDSDVLNLWLLQLLDTRQRVAREAKKQYAYADNYEKFMTIIDKNSDEQMLSQIRLSIMAEITEASAFNALKKLGAMAGQKHDKQQRDAPSTKATHFMNRDLNIYLKQLMLCRVHCERRLCQLGGAYYQSLYGASVGGSANVKRSAAPSPAKKTQKKAVILDFYVIVNDEELCGFLREYLKTQSVENLLDFWTGVHHMLADDISQKYIAARDLFQSFVATARPVLVFERADIYAMEQFLLGNAADAHAFSQAADRALDMIKNRWYLSFLMSREYDRLLKTWKYRRAKKEELDSETDSLPDDDNCSSSGSVASSTPPSTNDANDADFQPRLAALDAKIRAKSHALEALKSYERARTNEVLVAELSEDLRALRQQRNAIETHLRRMRVWSEHLGGWRACVYELSPDDEIVVIVFRSGDAGEPGASISEQLIEARGEGWLVTRSLADFQRLKVALVPLASWFRDQALPRAALRRKLPVDMVARKLALNEFLAAILRDSRLSKSQSVFHFLCPLPEELQEQLQPWRAADLHQHDVEVGGGWGGAGVSAVDLRLYGTDDELGGADAEVGTEALFQLVRVVFEVRGALSLVRRAVVNTVRSMYGRTLGHFLADYATWATCDTMLVYYLELVRDALWPGGRAAEWGEARSEADQQATARECRSALLRSLPDVADFVLGAENTRAGVLLLFEAAQRPVLNRTLLYGVLHQLLLQMFPELREAAASAAADEREDGGEGGAALFCSTVLQHSGAH